MYALVLCGPPGCGKSTYALHHLPAEFQIFSTDDLIIREAKRREATYDEIYADYAPKATEIFHAQIQKANQYGLPFIIDRTNATEDVRKYILSKINPAFKKIGIYFPAYTSAILKKNIDKRVSAGGHKVSEEVIQKFHTQYRLPQKTEGFDLVVSSSHFIDVMKVMEFKDV